MSHQVYTLPGGQQVLVTDSFQIGRVNYPNGWLAGADASDLASLGITVTTVQDPMPAPTSVQVNSASAPSLNGVYAFDPQSTRNITAETVFIGETQQQGNATFTNGQVTRGWPDVNGTLHTFTIAEFIAFAEALAAYVDSVIAAGQTAAANGTIPVWPSGPVTIP